MKDEDRILLLDVPTELKTERLFLRAARSGDGAIGCPVTRELLPELKQWMPWATDAYSLEDAESWFRKAVANFHLRKEFHFLIFLHNDEYLGNCGLFAFDWNIPKCEIGYWLRTSHTGKGYMTEAVNALTALAMESLKVERVELRTDDLNERSNRVAERSGFQLEGTLHNDFRYPDGRLRNTRVYAKVAR